MSSFCTRVRRAIVMSVLISLGLLERLSRKVFLRFWHNRGTSPIQGTLTLGGLEYQDIGLYLQRIAQFLHERGFPRLAEAVLPEAKLSTEMKIEETMRALNGAGPFLLVIDNLESVQNEDQTLHDPELLFFLQKLLTNLRGGRVIVTGRWMRTNLNCVWVMLLICWLCSTM